MEEAASHARHFGMIVSRQPYRSLKFKRLLMTSIDHVEDNFNDTRLVKKHKHRQIEFISCVPLRKINAIAILRLKFPKTS